MNRTFISDYQVYKLKIKSDEMDNI